MEGVMSQLVPAPTNTNSTVADAQQIMYAAFDESNPRRRLALARKALETSSDCADAYVLLAEHAQSLPEALELYEQGVAAGERALGEEGFREYEGHFWGILETRPYMRAREGLAHCLRQTGRREEAAEHFREMLRLNPNDNQGVRYCLASLLLDLEHDDELHRLLTT
jgi:tetratricopeptide (TPR) repeat protein